MTENEWLSSSNLDNMLKHSQTLQRQRFMIACCRSIWPLFTDVRHQAFIEQYERWVNEEGSTEELEASSDRLPQTPRRAYIGGGIVMSINLLMNPPSVYRPTSGVVNFHELPYWCKRAHDCMDAIQRCDPRAVASSCRAITSDYHKEQFIERHPLQREIAEQQAEIQRVYTRVHDLHLRAVGDPIAHQKTAREFELSTLDAIAARNQQIQAEAKQHAEAVSEREHGIQVSLLRCIIGNPTRPLVIDAAWRTTAVLGLAEAIRDDHAYDRMPILADALEEAGCDDPFILRHARYDSTHCRHCAVLNVILQ